MTANRIDRLRAKLVDSQLDGVLISAAENRRYLSGFTGSSGYLLITHDKAILATDFRYTEQASKQSEKFEIFRISSADWLASLLAELNIPKLGFESSNVTVAAYTNLKETLATSTAKDRVQLIPMVDLVEPLRATKSLDELALITKAVEIADQAYEEISPTIEVGDTEESVAWRLERSMRERGAEAIAFDIIVAAGPNGAMAHHRADQTPILNGQPVVMDFGARYQGYCSDITRTICLGEPDETFRKVYDTVLGAQLTASATVEAGMTGEQADNLARNVIKAAGHGDQFGHSLGHGIGLAVHEDPRVGPRATNILENGTIFTVEPGIYIPGWGGVRIEDIVVMENGRARILTMANKRDNPV
jgi:Xaa-Pro aminopeptidase